MYDYDKRLNFKPGFNLWQQNFEEPPYSDQVSKLIKIMRIEAESYVPRFDAVMKKRTYMSQGRQVTYYVVSPKDMEEEKLPVIIYYHGGGFNCPVARMMFNNACFFADRLKCHVLIPDYDIAPEVSSDTIVEECYDMLIHAGENAEQLHIDMNDLVIYGDSAGGALATAVTLLARDRKKSLAASDTDTNNKISKIFMPRLLMLIYPVCDYVTDENKYPSMGLEEAEWNKAANGHMWNILFTKGRGRLSDYIAPLQNASFADMPDSYIEVCEFDTLRDQGIALHEALVRNGNKSELRLVKGTYHGYDSNIDNEFAREQVCQRGRFSLTHAGNCDNLN